MSSDAETGTGGAPPQPGNVDQIREIIFGAQIRDYEDRFRDLKADFQAQISALDGKLLKALESAAAKSQAQIQKLREQLKDERSERTKGEKASARDLRKNRSDIDKALVALESALEDTAQRLDARLDERSGALEGAKVDREGLADLLSAMAGRLRDGDGD